MTWFQLFIQLSQMTPEQLKTNVTVYTQSNNEFLPVSELVIADDMQSVLDIGHPVLFIQLSQMTPEQLKTNLCFNCLFNLNKINT